MITIIFGSNGVGKSSLMNHFLNESAFDHDRIYQGQEEIYWLNQEYGIDISTPQHMTYLNGTATFQKDGYDARENLQLYPERLGIQSEAPEGVKCQFILPYATLGIDEAQTWFSSRDGHVQNYQFSFFEKHRHNNLNIYMSTTRARLIDLRIRELAQGMHVLERKIIENKFGSKSIEWTVNLIPVGEIDGYINANPKDRKQFAKRAKILCGRDIFEIYDPESCKKSFYEGFNSADFNFKRKIS